MHILDFRIKRVIYDGHHHHQQAIGESGKEKLIFNGKKPPAEPDS